MKTKMKPILGFDLLYKVDIEGRVWSPYGRRWKRLIGSSVLGYRRVGLRKNGKLKQCLVHRLVLEVFVGPCPQGMESRHFPDHARTNNRLSNLSWTTKSQNELDKRANGTDSRGERNGSAKLTWRQVQKIRELYVPGKYSYRKVAVQLNLAAGTVYDVISKKHWKL